MLAEEFGQGLIFLAGIFPEGFAQGRGGGVEQFQFPCFRILDLQEPDVRQFPFPRVGEVAADDVMAARGDPQFAFKTVIHEVRDDKHHGPSLLDLVEEAEGPGEVGATPGFF